MSDMGDAPQPSKTEIPPPPPPEIRINLPPSVTDGPVYTPRPEGAPITEAAPEPRKGEPLPVPEKGPTPPEQVPDRPQDRESPGRPLPEAQFAKPNEKGMHPEQEKKDKAEHTTHAETTRLPENNAEAFTGKSADQSPRSKSSPFPWSTNLNFEHIEDPKLRAAAFENQNDLKAMEQLFGKEYLAISKVNDRVSLGEGGKTGELSIGIKTDGLGEELKGFLGERAGNVLMDVVNDMTIGDGGLLGTALEFVDALRGMENHRLLGANTPEAKQWRENKRLELVVDKMADSLRENALQEHRPFPSKLDAPEYLLRNYHQMEHLIQTQLKNSPPSRGPRIPEMSQG